MKTSSYTWAFLLFCAALPAQKLDVKETHRFRFDGGETESLAFSPDEKFLACGGEGGDLVVYDLATKEPVLRVDVSFAAVRQLRFFPGGRRLAVMSHDLSFWSFPEGELLGRWKSTTSWDSGSPMDISPNGASIAYRLENEVLVRDSKHMRIEARIGIEKFRCETLLFSPTGNKLVLDARAIWPWKNKGSGMTLIPQVGPSWYSQALYLGSDSRLLLATCGEELVLGTKRFPLGCEIRDLVSSRDAKRVAVLTNRNGVLLYDNNLVPQGSIAATPKSNFPCFALAGSGALMATAGEDDPVIVWKKGKRLFQLPGNARRPTDVVLDPHGRFLAVRFDRHALSLDLQNGHRRDIGRVIAISPGWRPAEFLLARYDKRQTSIDRYRADLGEAQPFPSLESESRSSGDRTFLASSTRNVFFFAQQARVFEEQFLVRTPENGIQSLEGRGYVRDLSWSRSGEDLILVTENQRTCGLSPRSGQVAIHGYQGRKFWYDPACKSAKSIGLPLTGGFSPSAKRVTFGGSHGAVTWSRSRKGDKIKKQKVLLFWLRYLDEDRFLAHDGQTLSLWHASDLKNLARANPLGVPRDLRRTSKAPKARPGGVSWSDETPIFIHKAILSRDGKRLVLIGNQDVRVFDLSLR